MPEKLGERLLQEIGQGLPIALYPKENLHVTIKFIGEVADAAIGAVSELGADVILTYHQPFECVPTHFYLAEERLRLAILPAPELLLFQKKLTEELRLKEFLKTESEVEAYAPHITLGRPETAFKLSDVMLDPTPYAFAVKEIGLYRSDPGPNRFGVYTLLKSFPLR